MLSQLLKAEETYILKYMQLGETQKMSQTGFGAAIPGVVVTQEATPADVVTVGAPILGKDVAVLVLKVEGKAKSPDAAPGR
ncbi:MAG: hypothetical protein KatS3mg061_0154 [Dehalococcoidia bacterium]|nr:MAG: hypothetical protein KatS3mg061_0154 [Dehalococcoidia bacterium]